MKFSKSLPSKQKGAPVSKPYPMKHAPSDGTVIMNNHFTTPKAMPTLNVADWPKSRGAKMGTKGNH